MRHTRWALLFFGLILVPVALLTYLSFQSLQDERGSIVADQQFIAGLLREEFGNLAQRIVRHITYAENPDLDLSIYDSYAEVRQAFSLDGAGKPTYPMILPLTLGQRNPDFTKALGRAQRLEFGQRDFKAAQQAYWDAWKEAQSESESAEVLNALGRCALAQKDVETAFDLHQKLTIYYLSFDPDGAHPVTLSHLRLARHLGPKSGSLILNQWIQALLKGDYPLLPGLPHRHPPGPPTGRFLGKRRRPKPDRQPRQNRATPRFCRKPAAEPGPTHRHRTRLCLRRFAPRHQLPALLPPFWRYRHLGLGLRP